MIHRRFAAAAPAALGPARGAEPVRMVTRIAGTTPLVLDSPHSGAHYPDDFGAACLLDGEWPQPVATEPGQLSKLRRYGDAARHRHSVQVKINRQIHMDEQTLAVRPDGMARLRRDLQELRRRLLATDPR